MLLLDKNNVLIGQFLRPLTTKRTVVQLDVLDPTLNWHPEALINEAQVITVILEKIEWKDTVFARIVGDTPSRLFKYEGFELWCG